jgi:two-component system response regulator GlrR
MLSAFQEMPNGNQLLGQSPRFTEQMNKIPMVAKCDANVLICGETGTGKELCAQAVHYLSPRAKKPFVAVNCGSLPLELLENELFGHHAGAFTSASTATPGLIRDADGGTLFLDEVVSLPLPAQVKLLRFLQEKEYRPLGSPKTERSDVRVIAASNIDAEKAVKNGLLRTDLYYRLNVIPINLPPLRERLEDIKPLARHFLVKYAAKFTKNVTDFDTKAIESLMVHNWPGNVRELEHVVQRAVVMAVGQTIQGSDIILPLLDVGTREESFKDAKARVIEQFEEDYVTKLLVAYRGNITRAAQAAKKNRRAFWELIRKHHIDVSKRGMIERAGRDPSLD